MSLATQLIAAEAVRLGATIWLDDPASAPFAADLAPGGAVVPARGWEVGQGAGGFGWARPFSAKETSLTCPLLAVSGDGGTAHLQGCRPDLWLRPGAMSAPPGFDALHPAIPGLAVRAGWRTADRALLEQRAADLMAGTFDPWDWMIDRLAGTTRLRDVLWPGDGGVALCLDPLSAVRADDDIMAYAAAVSGAVRLRHGRPLRLRIPTLGLRRLTVMLGFEGAGAVEVAALQPGLLATVERRAQYGGGKLFIAADLPATERLWIDLDLLGRSSVLAQLEIHLPDQTHSANAESHDPLVGYADPLAAYSAGSLP